MKNDAAVFERLLDKISRRGPMTMGCPYCGARPGDNDMPNIHIRCVHIVTVKDAGVKTQAIDILWDCYVCGGDWGEVRDSAHDGLVISATAHGMTAPRPVESGVSDEK